MPRKIAKLKPHFALDELIEADPFRGREMAWAMARRVDRLSVNMMGYVRLKDLLRPTIIRPIRQLKRVRNRIVATVARRGEERPHVCGPSPPRQSNMRSFARRMD